MARCVCVCVCVCVRVCVCVCVYDPNLSPRRFEITAEGCECMESWTSEQWGNCTSFCCSLGDPEGKWCKTANHGDNLGTFNSSRDAPRSDRARVREMGGVGGM